MSRLLEELHQAAREYQLFLPGDKIVVAVSGGVDSVCLLHALGDPDLGLQRLVVYVHHGLRAEADEEGEWIRRMGQQMNVPVVIRRIDVRGRARKTGESIQMAARQQRYRVLQEEAAAWGARRIALAHHGDDQAETILLRILTGTGPEGLGGMAYIKEPYIRPLLNVRREEILAYAKENELEWVEDRSNRDTHYLRNRIRLEVIPGLEQIQPQLVSHLNRLATVTREWRDWLADALAEAEADLGLTMGEQSVSWLIDPWQAAPRPLQRAVLKKGFYHLFPNRRLEIRHQDLVLDYFQQRSVGYLQLPGAGAIAGDGKSICLYGKGRPAVSKEEIYIPMTIPGETKWPGGRLTAEILQRESLPDEWRKAARNEAYFGIEDGTLRLFLRNRRIGDRIITFGHRQPEKLKKLLIDAKIPYREREKVPLVVDEEDNIRWVVGVRHANLGRVESKHEKILHLTFCQDRK